MEILFITRKHPPAVGGMEKLSYHLTKSVAEITPTRKIALKKGQWLPFFMISAFFQAGRLCGKGKVSVVHLGDPVLSIIGVILKKLFRVPVAVTCHGLDLTYDNWLYQKYLDLFFNNFDLYIGISRYAQELAAKRVPGKTTFIPVGVSPEYKYVNRKRNGKTLITTGRLVKRKGVMWFLKEVFPRLKDYKYIIVGDGPEKDKIAEAVQKNSWQKRVRIVDNASDEQIRELYAAADIFVMPNITVPGDAEGFGIVALEASAAGLPVIASSIEGIKDAIIYGKNGYLVNEKDAEGFVKAIKKAKAPKSFSDYTLKEYSWRKIAEKYVEAFKIVKNRQDAK